MATYENELFEALEACDALSTLPKRSLRTCCARRVEIMRPAPTTSQEGLYCEYFEADLRAVSLQAGEKYYNNVTLD